MPVHTFHAWNMEKTMVEHKAHVDELTQMTEESREKAEQAGNGKGTGKGKDMEKGKAKPSGWGNKAMALVIAVFNRNWEQVTQMAKEYASVPWMKGAIAQKTGWDLDLLLGDWPSSDPSSSGSSGSGGWHVPLISDSGECHAAAAETLDNPWSEDNGA